MSATTVAAQLHYEDFPNYFFKGNNGYMKSQLKFHIQSVIQRSTVNKVDI